MGRPRKPVVTDLLMSQQLFAELFAELVLFAIRSGYLVTLDEAYRPPETAALYAKQGRGIRNSLHCDRLAVDLNLFKDREYLQNGDDYEVLGNWWRKQHPLCRWGGDFRKPDYRHFSISYQGRA